MSDIRKITVDFSNRKVITGEKAVKLYSELTGKSVEDIRKDAGYTKYDG